MAQTEEAEKRNLQDQIGEFKKVISSSAQTENQVADDVIRARSDQLFYDIQAFVVKYFRGVQFGKMLAPDTQSGLSSSVNF